MNAAAIVAQAEQTVRSTHAGNVMIWLSGGEAGLATLEELTHRGMSTASATSSAPSPTTRGSSAGASS